jgi:hypothetical protein
MRPELRPGPYVRPGCGEVPGERRGHLVGAQLAPVPADRGGQPSSACKFELVGLANNAGPDGAGAFRRWQRSSATPARPSALCAPAWTGWKPRASSSHATLTSSRVRGEPPGHRRVQQHLRRRLQAQPDPVNRRAFPRPTAGSSPAHGHAGRPPPRPSGRKTQPRHSPRTAASGRCRQPPRTQSYNTYTVRHAGDHGPCVRP